MKRFIALLLACLLVFTACTQQKTIENKSEETVPTQSAVAIPKVHYTGLNDPALLTQLESTLYTDLIGNLGEGYFIENIEAIYLSKEYIEELTYNSQENIYFGYTLSELEEQFQGTKYIFTLGEDGETNVKAFEAYDDTYEKIIKNVAIGAGVILLCVTISVVSGGAGAPAACVIFATSAKAGAIGALTGATFSGATAGIVTGIQTNDFDQAKKAAALSASEGFKWGAITGAIAGGATSAIALKGATLNGLTMNEAAQIQRESKYPLDVIKQFKSMEEFQVYKDAGLVQKMVDGKLALVRDIDLNYVSELAGKQVTNLERMKLGYAPIESATGKAYQLHHIGQKADATLAILTESEHQGNSVILNMVGKESEIDRVAFDKIRMEFWKSFVSVPT